MFPDNRKKVRRRLGGERLNLANQCKVITASSGHAYEINKQKISFLLKVGPGKLALETKGKRCMNMAPYLSCSKVFVKMMVKHFKKSSFLIVYKSKRNELPLSVFLL